METTCGEKEKSKGAEEGSRALHGDRSVVTEGGGRRRVGKHGRKAISHKEDKFIRAQALRDNIVYQHN